MQHVQACMLHCRPCADIVEVPDKSTIQRFDPEVQLRGFARAGIESALEVQLVTVQPLSQKTFVRSKHKQVVSSRPARSVDNTCWESVTGSPY